MDFPSFQAKKRSAGHDPHARSAASDEPGDSAAHDAHMPGRRVACAARPRTFA